MLWTANVKAEDGNSVEKAAASATAKGAVAANMAARTGVLHADYNPKLPTLFLIGDSTVKNSWDTGGGWAVGLG